MTQTINLTTLNLSQGTHTITVTAKGTNWRGSAHSGAVTYAVAETSNFALSDGSVLLTSDGQVFNTMEE